MYIYTNINNFTYWVRRCSIYKQKNIWLSFSFIKYKSFPWYITISSHLISSHLTVFSPCRNYNSCHILQFIGIYNRVRQNKKAKNSQSKTNCFPGVKFQLLGKQSLFVQYFTYCEFGLKHMPPSSAYKISAVVFGLKFYKNNTKNDRTNINCFDQQENLRSN